MAQKKEEEGIVVKCSSWSDGTKNMVQMLEFENAEDFAKVWNLI